MSPDATGVEQYDENKPEAQRAIGIDVSRSWELELRDNTTDEDRYRGRE